MHVQEEERQTSQRLLVEFAEREKKWSMEVDEEEDHQEPNSPASKKARTEHTPRVVLLLPNTTQHHCSLAVFSLVSGLQHLQHLLAQGPYQRLQPTASPPAPEGLQKTQQHQQPHQEPVLVKAMPPIASSYLGLFKTF